MTDKNAHIQRRNGKEFHDPGTVELGKLKVTVLTRVHGTELRSTWMAETTGPERRDEGTAWNTSFKVGSPHLI